MSLQGRRTTSDEAQRTKLSVPYATGRTATVPQPSKYQTSGANAKSVSRNRMSVGSSSSAGLKLASSGDNGPRVGKETRRPSNLPRSTSSHSNTKLATIATSRPPPGSATAGRPKPDVLPSSIGVYEKSRTTNMLRRKTPSIEQHMARDLQGSYTRGTPGSSHASPAAGGGGGQDLETDAIFGIAFSDTHKPSTTNLAPPVIYSQTRPTELPPSLIPELQALAASNELTRSQGLPAAPVMSSPSSLYSNSPEPWSSRNTTPMSMSSYSPGIIQSLKLNPPLRRLNITPSQSRDIKSRHGEPQRTEAPKLPPVQEAAMPSTSGSTAENPVTPKSKAEKAKRKKTPSPAPTPPPRKSSTKFKSPKSEESKHDVGEEIIDPEPNAAYGNPPDSPLRERNARTARTIDYVGQSLEESSSYGHAQSESQLHEPPPSRHGQGEAGEAGLKAFPTLQNNLAQSSNRPRELSESIQPQVSHGLQKSGDSSFSQPADWVKGQRAPRTPLINTCRKQPKREMSAVAPGMAVSTPSRKIKPTSTGPEDSDKETKLTPRSGFSKISTFFSRRARSDSTEGMKDNIARSTRKGPAAGTGHEGYRKYAFRSRKMSSESTASSDSRSFSYGNIAQRPSTSRKDSASSHRNSRNSKEDPAAEQFIAQRLEPVVILGGGGYRNRPERDAPAPWPTNDGGLALNRSGYNVGEQNASEVSAAGLDKNAVLVEPSAKGTDTGFSRTQGADLSSTSRLTGERLRTARRSFDRTSVYGDQNNANRIPMSMKTEGLAIVPAPESYTTSQSSLPQTVSTLPVVENEMHKVDAKYLKKQSKKARSLKWNFFQRGQNSDKGIKVAEPEARRVVEVPVTITNNPNPRPVPYYAMLDSETDIGDPETLGDFLAQAVDSPSLVQANDTDPYNPESQRRHGNSVLLPSLPLMRTDLHAQAQPASPKVQLRQEVQTQEDTRSPSNPKPPRLAQVGRIPRVISRKDYHHVPPVESFSRPFSRGRIGNPPAPAETQRPVLGIQTDMLPSRPFEEYDSGKPTSAPARALISQNRRDARAEQEFLAFTSRHGSEVSISSDSEGIVSIAAPQNHFPVHHHGEEEVWIEYDDFIDRVFSPAEERKTQTLGQSGRTATDRALGGRRVAQPKKEVWMRTDSAPTTTSALFAPINWQAPARGSGGSSDDVRLRRSRIVSALHSSLSPTSPFSLADLVAEYAERNRVSAQLPRNTSDAIKAETAYLSPLTYGSPSDFSTAVPSHHQSTLLLDVAERDNEGPAAQSELHFAALMTSKWLSFGRVLFSPAHQQVETLPQQQILVIDGLRNSDWSFYCALTYPSATIHDLRESDLPPNLRQPPSNDSSRAPPNYRRVEQPSLAERFPFSTSFFAAVVLRFPPAMSDAVLKLLVVECKRVLMPGGYLEFMVMDMDMVNMGPYTRRAVKDLKVRMTEADPGVSLKPASDNIQSVLGRKGFEGLNRCIVGIPVAGKVAGSVDSSPSSRSSKGSYTQKATDAASTPAAGARAESAKRHHEENTNFSLSDLIADHSPTSDEKITKMVAKVGRYWFLRSFEAAVLPNGDPKKSILADKKVLHECKNRGSGFKLLIAYAQKPAENRRRTVSEPSLPTLATAGTPAMMRTI